MSGHAWQFVRAGGVDQVVIRTGADIAHLAELDQKLWVALACPTRGIEFDARTLELIDANHDGRIRPPELVSACQWACERVRDPDVLARPREAAEGLALADLATEREGGEALLQEARGVLAALGRPEDPRLTLAQVREHREHMAARPFNGDGLVTPAGSDDPATHDFIAQVAHVQGTRPDRSGQPGIGRDELDAFVAQAHEQQQWRDRPLTDTSLAPLGEHSLAAARAAEAVREKVDDYFARCRVAAFDPLALPALNPAGEAYRAIAGDALLDAGDARLVALPLAAIGPDRALPLKPDALNPAWADAVQSLRRDAIEPWRAASGRGGDAFDTAALSSLEWSAMRERLSACLAWLDEQPPGALRDLDDAALYAALDPARYQALLQLMNDDEAAGPQFERVDELEKLLLLQRDLLPLLNNFVSFISFYRREHAIFQAGTLFLDARSCDLTVSVPEPAKHAVLAGLAKTCLAYCNCRRGSETMHIVAAFTSGDVDFLFVGRNGVFYDRQGRDWDATITQLIENPTSIAQAFFSPYKKFVRLVEEQVAKRAAASDAAAQGRLGGVAEGVAQVGQAATPAPVAAPSPASPPALNQPGTAATPAKPFGRFDVGTVAALGVALGSMSTVMVAMFGKFVDLGWWIPLALLGLVLAISGPSMLIAWLKLRQRSLGPLLDASGWAINGRMHINMRLGASLSQAASLPRLAQHSRRDPFAERRAPTYAVAGVAILLAGTLLAWRFELLNSVLPSRWQPTAAVQAPAGANRIAQAPVEAGRAARLTP